MARVHHLVAVCTWMHILCRGINVVEASAGNEWGYDGTTGPEQWHVDFPQCSGSMQSPISIDTASAVLSKNLTDFDLHGYDNVTDVKMTLQNNGHSVQVDLQSNDMYVSQGGLPGTYRAKQFHFHWGSVDQRGSEHDINGQHFPMEMHVVHFNDIYPTFNDAVNKTNGLLVLGFFFEVGSHNPHFDELIRHFFEIAHKDDHVSIPTFPLKNLFPTEMHIYYRYYGSLTTPPCSESVIWTLFKNTVKISEDQLMKFRYNVYKNYVNETDRNISDDFRPSQPLNRRLVYASHLDAIYNNKSCVTLVSFRILFLCLIISKITYLRS